MELDSPATHPVTVGYGTADGSAQAGVDYVATTGVALFRTGESAKTIQVLVLDDAHDEGEETLSLKLMNVSGARLLDAEANDSVPFWDPVPGGPTGTLDRSREMCIQIWNTREPEVVDLRIRVIFSDQSRSDWAEVLGLPFPANPNSATTAGMADQDGVVKKAYGDGSRRR